MVPQNPLTRLRDRLDDFFDKHPILGLIAFPIEIAVVILAMLFAGVAIALSWGLIVFAGWGLWTIVDKLLG